MSEPFAEHQSGKAITRLREPSVARLPQSATPRSALRTLIVEDNPINLLIAVRMMEQMGHTCSVARNGLEALEALESRAFDLVLMDVQMPVMDGLETTRRIREGERSCGGHLPIIAVTTNDREPCLVGGMDGYVPKPVRSRELEEVIDDVLCTAAAGCTGRVPQPHGAYRRF